MMVDTVAAGRVKFDNERPISHPSPRVNLLITLYKYVGRAPSPPIPQDSEFLS